MAGCPLDGEAGGFELADALAHGPPHLFDSSTVGAAAIPPYGEPASPKGVPSESRQITQRSPGWTISPPSARTRSTAAGRSATGK